MRRPRQPGCRGGRHCCGAYRCRDRSRSTAEQGNEGKNLKALLGAAINLLADRFGNVYAQVLAEKRYITTGEEKK